MGAESAWHCSSNQHKYSPRLSSSLLRKGRFHILAFTISLLISYVGRAAAGPILSRESAHLTPAPCLRGRQMSAGPRLSRKYGRWDFDRFDDVAPDVASAGGAYLGKSHVDCRFLFRKSKWGMLGAQDSAGIIYLDLTFDQPSHCRLRSATVKVTLDDEDEDLALHFPSSKRSRKPVQIGEHGPRHMRGGPRYETVTRRKVFMPSLDVGGFGGVGGMGSDTAAMQVRECHWTFTSHLMTDSRKKRKAGWSYKVLKWELSENELDPQADHPNVVHVAFSFVHGDQPFFMRVEVSGKLDSVRSDTSERIRRGIRRLKLSPSADGTSHATTLINFNGRKFTTPLDGEVRKLEEAMENENSQWMDVSTTESADFQRAAAATAARLAHPKEETRPPMTKRRTSPLVGQVFPSEEVEHVTTDELARLSSWAFSAVPHDLSPASDTEARVDGLKTDPPSTVAEGEMNGKSTNHEQNLADKNAVAQVRGGVPGDPVKLETLILLMQIWLMQNIRNIMELLHSIGA